MPTNVTATLLEGTARPLGVSGKILFSAIKDGLIDHLIGYGLIDLFGRHLEVT